MSRQVSLRVTRSLYTFIPRPSASATHSDSCWESPSTGFASGAGAAAAGAAGAAGAGAAGAGPWLRRAATRPDTSRWASLPPPRIESTMPCIESRAVNNRFISESPRWRTPLRASSRRSSIAWVSPAIFSNPIVADIPFSVWAALKISLITSMLTVSFSSARSRSSSL